MNSDRQAEYWSRGTFKAAMMDEKIARIRLLLKGYSDCLAKASLAVAFAKVRSD